MVCDGCMEKSCFDSEVGAGRPDLEGGDVEMLVVLLVDRVEGNVIEGEGDVDEAPVVGDQTLIPVLWCLV